MDLGGGGSLTETGTESRFTVGRRATGGGAGAAPNRECKLGLLEAGLGERVCDPERCDTGVSSWLIPKKGGCDSLSADSHPEQSGRRRGPAEPQPGARREGERPGPPRPARAPPAATAPSGGENPEIGRSRKGAPRMPSSPTWYRSPPGRLPRLREPDPRARVRGGRRGEVALSSGPPSPGWAARHPRSEESPGAAPAAGSRTGPAREGARGGSAGHVTVRGARGSHLPPSRRARGARRVPSSPLRPPRPQLGTCLHLAGGAEPLHGRRFAEPTARPRNTEDRISGTHCLCPPQRRKLGQGSASARRPPGGPAELPGALRRGGRGWRQRLQRGRGSFPQLLDSPDGELRGQQERGAPGGRGQPVPTPESLFAVRDSRSAEPSLRVGPRSPRNKPSGWFWQTFHCFFSTHPVAPRFTKEAWKLHPESPRAVGDAHRGRVPPCSPRPSVSGSCTPRPLTRSSLEG